MKLYGIVVREQERKTCFNNTKEKKTDDIEMMIDSLSRIYKMRKLVNSYWKNIKRKKTCKSRNT